MLRTIQFASTLLRAEADALNRESGRIYSDTLTRHYRLYRKQGVWLTLSNGKRVEDMAGGSTCLHAHSRDAAQEAFYKACKTARSSKAAGLDAKYPHWRKRFRTTIWKSSGIRLKAGHVLLARAKGLSPVQVPLPDSLLDLPEARFLEVRLVWEQSVRHYSWHVVVEDGVKPEPASGATIAAVDLGVVHPAALTDGKEACIISCRALRANQQYTTKRLRAIRAKQERKRPGSRAWRRLQRRKMRFHAKQKRRARDMEHKASRAVVRWAKEHTVGTLVIGNMRDAADGKLSDTQPPSQGGFWAQSRQRQYISYKAKASGITVTSVEEAYTSQTCPKCLECYKPKGRVYLCPACGFRAHRDGVGAANLLSQHYTGEPGHVLPPPPNYRYPYLTGKRSRPDTADLAWGPTAREGPSQELPG